jgi:hypothetical protein
MGVKLRNHSLNYLQQEIVLRLAESFLSTYAASAPIITSKKNNIEYLAEGVVLMAVNELGRVGLSASFKM